MSLRASMEYILREKKHDRSEDFVKDHNFLASMWKGEGTLLEILEGMMYMMTPPPSPPKIIRFLGCICFLSTLADVPVSLIDHVIHRDPQQLHQHDYYGNTPLHILASVPPCLDGKNRDDQSMRNVFSF